MDETDEGLEGLMCEAEWSVSLLYRCLQEQLLLPAAKFRAKRRSVGGVGGGQLFWKTHLFGPEEKKTYKRRHNMFGTHKVN